MDHLRRSGPGRLDDLRNLRCPGPGRVPVPVDVVLLLDALRPGLTRAPATKGGGPPGSDSHIPGHDEGAGGHADDRNCDQANLGKLDHANIVRGPATGIRGPVVDDEPVPTN